MWKLEVFSVNEKICKTPISLLDSLFMEGVGFEVKGGKHIDFRFKGQQRLISWRSLSEGHSENEIRYVIAGAKAKNKRTSKEIKT